MSARVCVWCVPARVPCVAVRVCVCARTRAHTHTHEREGERERLSASSLIFFYGKLANTLVFMPTGTKVWESIAEQLPVIFLYRGFLYCSQHQRAIFLWLH